MSKNVTMTMHKEMEDMRKETPYHTVCLSGGIAGSHDVKQGSLYLYKEGQLDTESSEHKICTLFGASDRGESAKKKKGHVHLKFILL